MPRGRRKRNAAPRRQRNTTPRRRRNPRPPRTAYLAQPDLDQGMPELCLAKILENLPIKNRLVYERVNSRWRDAVRRSFERVSSQQLHEFLEFCQQNPRLNVKKMLDTIELCAKHMPVVVFKTTFGKEIDAEILEILAHKDMSFTSLTLDVNDIDENAKYLKSLLSKGSLRELDVTLDEWDLYTLSIRAIKSVSPRLRRLSLTIREPIVSNNVARYEMEVMFENLPRTITHLTIKSQNVFALPTLFKKLGKFTKLEELELDSLGEIHEHISHARDKTEKSLKKLTRLKRLHLSGLKSDFHIGCLYHLRSLESVRIRGCSRRLGYEQARERFRETMLRCNKKLKAENIFVGTGLIDEADDPAAE
ncbi:uncharacterized protein LOC106653627 [Trichogramma pretiosum]|uniref:uncharacterized protein LOC106653627 n=1 Tax=Trichogramma pretiosum TaxID=7493 RepID=UPI0006C9C986|nr:uncharacterized protein LOC106653627 [Trichogramma pretiosum]